jgi:hypothetical protein
VRIGSNGPFTITSVVHLWNGNYEKARLGVNAAVKAGALRCLGEGQFKEVGGRKERIFCASGLKVKSDRVLHDAMMFKYALTLQNARYRLAYDCDPKLLPDAEFWFSNGKVAYGEMDMMTESLSTVIKRLGGYEPENIAIDPDQKPPFMVLFITLSQARIDKLKLRLEDRWIAKCLMFGLWYDLIEDGQGGIWETCKGTRGRVCPKGG